MRMDSRGLVPTTCTSPASVGWPVQRGRRQDYLFSGLFICVVCGYRIVGGNWKYCVVRMPVHRYKGACPNKLTIRCNRLEHKLLDALATRVLQPDILEHTILEFISGSSEVI